MNLAQPERTSGRGKSFPRVADYLWSVSVVPAPLSVLLHPAVGLIGSSLTICHWFIFLSLPGKREYFFCLHSVRVSAQLLSPIQKIDPIWLFACVWMREKHRTKGRDVEDCNLWKAERVAWWKDSVCTWCVPGRLKKDVVIMSKLGYRCWLEEMTSEVYIYCSNLSSTAAQSSSASVEFVIDGLMAALTPRVCLISRRLMRHINAGELVFNASSWRSSVSAVNPLTSTLSPWSRIAL